MRWLIMLLIGLVLTGCGEDSTVIKYQQVTSPRDDINGKYKVYDSDLIIIQPDGSGKSEHIKSQTPRGTLEIRNGVWNETRNTYTPTSIFGKYSASTSLNDFIYNVKSKDSDVAIWVSPQRWDIITSYPDIADNGLTIKENCYWEKISD